MSFFDDFPAMGRRDLMELRRDIDGASENFPGPMVRH